MMLKNQYINIFLNFLDKYYSIICFLIVLILYVPHLKVISWGDDYAGYILQSEAMFSGTSKDFIEIQKYLFALSENPRYAIYYPIGMPVLIGLTSFLTDYDPYLVKLIIPILLYLIAIVLKNYKTNFLTILILFHPTITDQYRDILGEIPATLFLMLGIKSKNFLLKNLFFVISCLIKPTFVIFVCTYLIFTSRKIFTEFFLFIVYLSSTQLISQNLFGMNFFGYYLSNDIGGSNIGIVEIFISNFLNLNLNRFVFFLEEIGLMLTGFSNPLNIFLGLGFMFFLLIYRNKYSFMILLFILFHFLIWGSDYFARYCYPVLFLLILLFPKIEIFKKFNSKSLSIMLAVFSIFFLQQIYGISKLDNQTGPHQDYSLELFAFVKDDVDVDYYNFHSPKTFRLFTKKEAYKFDNNLLPNSSLICYKEKKCLTPDSYTKVFENEIYYVYKKK